MLQRNFSYKGIRIDMTQTENKNTDKIFATVNNLEFADEIRQTIISEFRKRRFWLFVYEERPGNNVWNISVADEHCCSLDDDVVQELKDFVEPLILDVYKCDSQDSISNADSISGGDLLDEVRQ